MNGKDDIRDDLSALIDGALDPDRQREVEAAVESDPELRAEYERLRGMDALYAALPRETAPEDFARGVRATIARRDSIAAPEPPQRPVKLRMLTQSARRSVFWPVAAAATLLVGFVLWTTVNTANRSNMMLSMEQPAPAKAAAPAGKDDALYKVRVMPEKQELAETPATAPAAAPSPPAAETKPEEAKNEADEKALADQPPPTADSMPALEPLRKEDRDRALGRMMEAKQAPPAPAEAPTGNSGPAPAPPAAAESAAAGAAPQAAAPAPVNAPEQRRVAGRVFLRADTGWVEQGYKGEVLTPIEEDSDEFRQLLPTHPPLEQVAALGGAITLRIDGVWRDLKTNRPIAGTI